MSFPGTFARERPDHPAVIMAGSGDSLTYRELDERSNQLAQLWHARGLRRGDHIAILLPNHLRYLEVVWAALRSGLYYTPVNWHLTAPEVAYIVGDCGARSVVTSIDLADRVTDVDPEVALVVDGELAGWERYEDVVGEQPTTPLAEEPEGNGMFYSSGTTGRPKGILFPLPDRTVHDVHPLVQYASPVANNGDDIYLSPAPLYHTAPSVWSGWRWVTRMSRGRSAASRSM